MSNSDPRLLTGLLKATSRSFYLTLRVLPAAVRPQIGLAYLLARATDTIADTAIVPVAGRLSALARLRERILGHDTMPLDFGELSRHQGLPAEQVLLTRCEEALAVLGGFEAADRARIRKVLDVITSGQELDLRRFGGGSAQNIIALANAAELDDYTWRVAGCVGEFWTGICRAHVFPKARLDDAWLVAQGIRFGKGLQLVNILRDLPMDLSNGRCYLPQEELAAAGLAPSDLVNPKNEPRFRATYARFLDLAEAHLRAGWDYTNALPRGCMRVRLACAWPIMIGMGTLEKLRQANVLDPDMRVKVGRAEVRGAMIRSVYLYPFPSAWRGMVRFKSP
jgi:farnesyl-diphosphate farnesyltransferase